MIRMRVLYLPLILALSLAAQPSGSFEVEEATIAQVHDAMKAGHLTCRALVDLYLKRIAAYDKNGPAINSIILVNPDIPKYASSQRPTPAEAMAVATGSNALFGTYAIDGAARTVILHIAASSYPNDNGTDQTRVVKSIGENQLILDIPALPNGGAAVELVFNRVE